VDVIRVKVWQDLELTSIGVFLPGEEEEKQQTITWPGLAILFLGEEMRPA
jgi:hypothetical protein